MDRSQSQSEYPSSRIRGFVLVGGRSSRFGQDKALYKIDGRPMALNVANVLRSTVDSVTLVGPPDVYRHLGLPVIPDAFEGIGPLGGIVAALEESDTEWNLIVACDLPLLTRDVLKQLVVKALGTTADVVWPRTADGRLQPLCAVYATRAAAHARSAVERGVRQVSQAFSGCRTVEVQINDNRPFSNINSVRDLESFSKVPDRNSS